MSRGRVGRESLGFGDLGRRNSNVDDLPTVVDALRIDRKLSDLARPANGDPAAPFEASFDDVMPPSKVDAIRMRKATRVDATIIAPAGKGGEEARSVEHERRPAAYGSGGISCGSL